MNIEEARKNLKVGDRVRVDGYGSGPEHESVEPTPMTLLVVGRIMRGDFEGHDDNGKWVADFRRSSIIEVIPAKRKPVVKQWDNCEHRISAEVAWYCSLVKGHEGDHVAYGMHDPNTPELARERQQPKPRIGEWKWRCATTCAGSIPLTCSRERCYQVYRSTGWSRDERNGDRRKGGRWVVALGDPVLFTRQATVGNLCVYDKRLNTRMEDNESWLDYYRRIGLDVNPINRRTGDRRKK